MEPAKIRKSIPKISKIRSELQKEIDSACPFCDNDDVGHFELHHIDENPSNNEISNLILLCPTCHSKVTKGDINQTVVLKRKIELIQSSSKLGMQTEKKAASTVNFNDKVNNAVVGDHNIITIKQIEKTGKQKYPPDCIGYDSQKKNYISHLITRYHEYKAYEVGKEKMNYSIFQASLKKKFKIGTTSTLYNLPTVKFNELASEIQARIDKTKLALIKGRNHKNYSTFEEYILDTNKQTT